MYGWAGTILRVDLSIGAIERQPLEKKLCDDFVGGRGLAAKILFDEVPPGIEPFPPHNKLIFSCGPLSGTSAPCPARFHVNGKAPLTGIMGNSNGGGYFGPAMKRAGFDHIVIQGKAEEPVYLWIDDGRVEIKKARHLWGKNIARRASFTPCVQALSRHPPSGVSRNHSGAPWAADRNVYTSPATPDPTRWPLLPSS